MNHDNKPLEGQDVEGSGKALHPEIRPCPFCGVKLIRDHAFGILTARHPDMDCILRNKEETVSKWNQRAPGEIPQGEPSSPPSSLGDLDLAEEFFSDLAIYDKKYFRAHAHRIASIRDRLRTPAPGPAPLDTLREAVVRALAVVHTKQTADILYPALAASQPPKGGAA